MKLNNDNQAKTYTASKSNKILMSIFGLLAVCFGFYTLYRVFFENNQSELHIKPILISLAIVSFIFANYLYFLAYRYKIQIFNDKIKCNFLFSEKELNFKDTKGYVSRQKTYFLHPKNAKNKKLTLLLDVVTDKELLSFIIVNFKDLDLQKIEKENNILYSNKLLGTNLEERIRKIKIFKRYLQFYCLCSCVLIIMGLFTNIAIAYIKPTMILLFLSIFIVAYYFERFKIDLFDNDNLGIYLLPLILMPGFVLLLKLKLDTLVDIKDFILPTVSIYILLMLILKTVSPNVKRLFEDKEYILLLVPFVFCLGFTGYINENIGVKNISKSKIIVKDKIEEFDSKRRANRYLNIEYIGNYSNTKKVMVYKYTFDKCNIGSIKSLNIYKGIFGIRWYEIE